MSLNLHALAATVVRDSGTPDPDTMVATLVEQIDPSDYREALTFLARDLIRNVIRSQREALLMTDVAPAGNESLAAALSEWRNRVRRFALVLAEMHASDPALPADADNAARLQVVRSTSEALARSRADAIQAGCSVDDVDSAITAARLRVDLAGEQSI